MPHITTRFVDRLAPKEKQYILYDDQIKGLGIRVYPNGTKNYVIDYQDGRGKRRRQSIGFHGSIISEEARQFANNILKIIALQKQDKVDEEENYKEKLTFGELFNIYTESYAKIHVKKWQETQRFYKRYIQSEFSNKEIDNITCEEIQNFCYKVKNRKGVYVANNIIILLKSIYTKAIEWRYYEDIPPTKYLRRFKVKDSRERFLQKEEFPKFFNTLNKETSQDFRDLVYLLLFTGQRKNNVYAMCWNDINIKEAYWHIKKTKNGLSARIPLIDEAITILKRRRKSRINKWVFPSTDSSTGHYVGCYLTWSGFIKRAGIEDLRMHDLRRTMASWQAMNGSSTLIISKSLGHKTTAPAHIYSRLNIGRVRESMGSAVKIIMDNIQYEDNNS